MNNKGFAITTILYGMLILFLMLLMSLLGMLATYKDRLEKLIENTNGAREIINKAPAYNPCDTPDDEVPTEVNDCGASGVSGGIPKFKYTGISEIVDDNDNVISDTSTWTCGWKIRFLTSGELTITELNGASNGIDVFLVGGGGGGINRGSNQGSYGCGGGGGYTKTSKNLQIIPNTIYQITIGNGGAVGNSGENTEAFNKIANGGQGSYLTEYHALGGSGGSGGGGTGGVAQNGGSNGASGSGKRPGVGQGFTTSEFGEENTNVYSTGGTGALTKASTKNPNTGDGGDGTRGNTASAGGSGIVVIRNARNPIAMNPNVPTFTYTGDYEVVNDDDQPITETDVNWKIRFLTSGVLTITELNGASNGIDVFLVGGGGGGISRGSTIGNYGGGGGGGYTQTNKNISIDVELPYDIIVGQGGANATDGENSSAFNIIANGGKKAYFETENHSKGGAGGSGGGGSYGGSNCSGGIDGGDGSCTFIGLGQGTTTREFGEVDAKLYATGGTGITKIASGKIPNTGNGGDGTTGYCVGSGGASGIVIIRNAR